VRSSSSRRAARSSSASWRSLSAFTPPRRQRAIGRGNRRETRITLSAKGQDLVDQVTRVRRREIGGIVKRIPPDLWPPTVAALNAFADAAGEVPQQAWALGWS
jgi:hypothetical protein